MLTDEIEAVLLVAPLPMVMLTCCTLFTNGAVGPALACCQKLVGKLINPLWQAIRLASVRDEAVSKAPL